MTQLRHSTTPSPLPRANRSALSTITGSASPLATSNPRIVHLVTDCPFCGRPAAYPGRSRNGALALAECDHCDVYFDFDANEVYAAGALDHSLLYDAS